MESKRRKHFQVIDIDKVESFEFEANCKWGYVICKVSYQKGPQHQQVDLEIRSNSGVLQTIQDVCFAGYRRSVCQVEFKNTKKESIAFTFANLVALQETLERMASFQYEYWTDCACFVNFQ